MPFEKLLVRVDENAALMSEDVPKMTFNEEETASVVASYLHSMYVEKKKKAIDHSTDLSLTLEQLAAEAICEDLVRRKVVGIGSEEQKDQLTRDVFNIIDLMYIRDKEKYRAMAAGKSEQFEILVARAVVGVPRQKWTKGDDAGQKSE